MTMKRGILVLAAGVLTGCVAPIDIPVREGEARLAIYSTLLDNDIQQRVTVQRTMPFFSTDLDASWVSDATVTISSSRGNVYSAQWDEGSHSYLTNQEFAAVPGVTYTLDVELDFDSDGTPEQYTASTTPLFPKIVIESTQIVPTEVMGQLIYRHLMFADEPAGKDYYVSRIAINDTIRMSNLEYWGLQDDRLFDGGRFEGMTVDIFPSEPDPEEKEPHNWLKPGDRVTLLLSTVDEDFFFFISEVQRSNQITNPFFGGPPYNLRTNISGGAMGYFGSLCSLRSSSVVPE
jgi:hypothetical protein